MLAAVMEAGAKEVQRVEERETDRAQKRASSACKGCNALASSV